MNRPLRVLMVARLFYPWVGGTERQALKLARELSKRGVSVEIVTGWWFRGTQQREVIQGIPVFRNHTLWEMLGVRGLRKFGGYLYILSLLWYLWRRRGEYDLIHVHGLNYHAFAAALAGRWFKRKTLVKLANSGQASDIEKMRGDRQLALARYMLPKALDCDRFVALNKKIVAELVAAGVASEKIVELANGVETDQIVTKSSYGLNNPVQFLYVGRLHEQKGLDVLLKAFQQLIRQKPEMPLRLQLVGDGPQRAALSRWVEQLGIASQVELMGESDQVMQHLQKADIFVLPSRAEGLSNALLEAMACGLPVVASRIPGNSSLIEHGKNGLLYDVEKPESLAKELAILLERSDLRTRLGAAARRSVEEHYGLDSIADSYLGLYQDLLSETHLAISTPVHSHVH